MNYTVEKSSQSMRDIEEAFVYIAEYDLDRAVYFLVAVEDALDMIAVHPMLGSNRAFENKKLKNLRLWPVKGFENYLIVYSSQSDEKMIRLNRLLHVNGISI